MHEAEQSLAANDVRGAQKAIDLLGTALSLLEGRDDVGAEQPQVAVQTLETAGVNRAALLGGCQIFQGDVAGHGITALGFSGCGDDAGMADLVTDSDWTQKTISDGAKRFLRAPA